MLRDKSIGQQGTAGTIPDSSAICAFLEKKFPTPAVYPADPFEHGRAVWLEEWADTELAGPIGLGVFRPILFARFQKKEPDLETARQTWNEKLPRVFDYLEGELAGKEFLIGAAMSIADVSVAYQLTNLELVAGLPDSARWPAVVAHTERMRDRKSFAANLAICRKIIKEPVDLSSLRPIRAGRADKGSF